MPSCYLNLYYIAQASQHEFNVMNYFNNEHSMCEFIYMLCSKEFPALILIVYFIIYIIFSVMKIDNEMSGQKKSKQMIYIYMDGEPYERKLQLEEAQFKSLRTLKKKILNQFGYEQSQGKNIQLHIMQIYLNQPQNIKTPVFNDQNLKLIMDFLTSYERPIKIQASLTQIEQLKKKEMLSQQALQKGEVHFDQNGSLVEQTDQMRWLLPTNQKYDNSAGHVRCQFCQKNNQDINYLKRCGGLYGPFLGQKYIHLLCAIWCHRVFLDEDDGYLKNVQQQIKRASTKKCRQCQEKGAGLTCLGQVKVKKGRSKFKKCPKNYHFKCAYETGCHMNWLTFKMLCPTCNEDENNQDLLLNLNEQNDMENQNQNDAEEEKEYDLKQYQIQPKQNRIKFEDDSLCKQRQQIMVKRQHI